MSSEARIISNFLEILSSVARIQVYKHFNKEMQKQYSDNWELPGITLRKPCASRHLSQSFLSWKNEQRGPYLCTILAMLKQWATRPIFTTMLEQWATRPILTFDTKTWTQIVESELSVPQKPETVFNFKESWLNYLYLRYLDVCSLSQLEMKYEQIAFCHEVSSLTQQQYYDNNLSYISIIVI